MKKAVIQFTTEYYPIESGFSMASQNFGRAILDQSVCDHVLVFSFKGFSSPDKRIKVINFMPPKNFEEKFLVSEKVGELYIGRWFPRLLSKLEKCLKTFDVRLILIEDTYLSFLIPHLRKYIDLPIITRIHGTSPEYAYYLKENYNKKFEHYCFKQVFNNKYVAATTPYYFNFMGGDIGTTTTIFLIDIFLLFLIQYIK